jgi:hypothetical protein
MEKVYYTVNSKHPSTPDHAFRVGRDAMYTINHKSYTRYKKTTGIYDMTQKTRNHSSASGLPFSGLASAFCQIVRAASWSRLGKRISNTSEYQFTGWPSMPCLMF